MTPRERITNAIMLLETCKPHRDIDAAVAEALGGRMVRKPRLNTRQRLQGTAQVKWAADGFVRTYPVPRYTKDEISREVAIKRLRETLKELPA